jgi:hypothetical protein
MKKVTMVTTGRPRGDFKIARPFNTVPKIESEYTEDGVRYYRTQAGGTYVADMYDKTFKITAGKVEKSGYKGRSASVDRAGLPISKGIKRFSNGLK